MSSRTHAFLLGKRGPFRSPTHTPCSKGNNVLNQAQPASPCCDPLALLWLQASKKAAQTRASQSHPRDPDTLTHTRSNFLPLPLSLTRTPSLLHSLLFLSLLLW